ncbi:MAG TPA: clostripain-related cysteine peptidase [Candidatus Angelobacter sp.]|nr:clostripain-related cysteine peptidase [Candidatus Angelobacter sp.]
MLSIQEREQQAQQHSKEDKHYNGGTGSPHWLVMIDIAADNNLANFAIETLKQLKKVNYQNVVVVVQFAVDAPGGQKIRRFVFDRTNAGPTFHPTGIDGSIAQNIADILDAPKNMTEEQALSSFLDWTYRHGPKITEDTKRILILWGHGPELLFQPPSGAAQVDCCGDANEDSQGLYLTPIELKKALKANVHYKKNDQDHRKLDIIAFDACSMGMIEVAYEIKNYARFMVASQEEVPDMSFPYDKLVGLLDREGDPAKICSQSVDSYVRDYQDYICDDNTGLKKVNLSAIDLGRLLTPSNPPVQPESKKSAGIKDALKGLALALCNARSEPGLPDLLVQTRTGSRDFAGGLYVDICSFCDRLKGALEAGTQISHGDAQDLIDACNAVCAALREPEGCILINRANDPAVSHGLSIYFPYLSDKDLRRIGQPLVKGGADTMGKGFTAIMNRAASNVLLCIRRQLIIDTEEYYEDLDLSIATCWYKFIVEVWSQILTDRLPDELDLRYSAQQASINLLKTIYSRGEPLRTIPPHVDNAFPPAGGGVKVVGAHG